MSQVLAGDSEENCAADDIAGGTAVSNFKPTDSSKLVLITGATNGIGLCTAKQLLSAGHKVIVASRDETKVTETVSRLSKTYPGTHVHGFTLDLGSLESVQGFVQALKDKAFSDRLDAVVLNAGITGLSSTIQFSRDGLETIFATNHLGHYYLTKQLLASSHYNLSPSRIVVVSSGTHDPASGSGTFGPNPDVKDWPQPAKFDGSIAYTSSKLANALYGNQLSRRFQRDQVSIAIYDPGFIGDTGLLRGLGFFQPVVKFIVETLIASIAWYRSIPNQNSTLERSSPFLARLAVDPELTSMTGRYYSIDHEHPCSVDASNTEKQDQLIELSNKILMEKGFGI
jgi:NAD(P)-dependent dehydrogenase (short-subunit alcohol dehydrogenase family)